MSEADEPDDAVPGTFQRFSRALDLADKDQPRGSSALGLALRTTAQNVNHWKNGGRQMSLPIAMRAQRKWAINAAWVLFAEAPMLIGAKPKSQSERPSDDVMDRTVDLLNVLAAARPSDGDLNPLNWSTISKAASAVAASTASDQRQLFAEVLACIKGT